VVTQVTLIRVVPDHPANDMATYIAVHTSFALEFVAEFPGMSRDSAEEPPLDAETMPWEALPGVRPLVAETMAGQPRRSVLAVGTSVAGQWTSWYPPAPRPPVPPLHRGV
jgi:hypothetical protein